MIPLGSIFQALGAMAAAGPHLSLQSWGPMFQAASVLGRASLLPQSARYGGGGGGNDGRSSDVVVEDGRRGCPGEISMGRGTAEKLCSEEEDEDLWAVLEAFWEFAFLQVS